MSIKKEDLYKLVEEMNESETALAYHILKSIVQKKIKDIDEIDLHNPYLGKEEQKEANVIKENAVYQQDIKHGKKTLSNTSENIEELLKEAERQSVKSEIQPRKFQRTKDGKLLLDPNKKFDKDWYENDEAFDLL